MSELNAQRIWSHLDALAKPRRSLGRLEALAVRLALTQRSLNPVVWPRRLVIFAGDHGVVARGVSAWPSDVTALMVGTMLMGRASSSALAAAHDCSIRLVDVGVASAKPQSPPAFYRDARVAPGTRDLSVEAAMTPSQFDAAWQVGADEAERAFGEGHRVLIAGEMGIGNTTPAACLTMLLANVPTETAVGRGAGLDDAALTKKRDLVASAVARVRAGAGSAAGERAKSSLAVGRDAADARAPAAPAAPRGEAPWRAGDSGDRASRITPEASLRPAIEAVAGFEIVAMAGYFAMGARLGATVLLDGYVATSAALIAEHLQPGVAKAMIAAHCSAEPGHSAALSNLGLEPLLDWGMRLGEGTGALVALPLLDSAAALLRDVAALSDLGVPRGD
jgi:nicotinate-nucleotide--dimethylbenzimidazole phosphoribosyltransferase